MANKKLQYQDVAKAPFVAPVAVAVFTAFSTFSPPSLARASIAVEMANAINTPIRPVISGAVFSQFSQPQVVTQTKAYEQPNVIFRVAPPPYTAPTFFGFSTFQPVFHAKPIVSSDFANFAHLTPPDFPPIQEKNDGIFVKKKRKPTKRELDPYKEETEIKEKRREAIIDAVYGPEVEYTLPPLAFPPGPVALPNLGDLPQIMLAAQQAHKAAQLHKAALEQADDDEIIDIMREIL